MAETDQFATRVAAAFAQTFIEIVRKQDISRTIKKNLIVLLDDVTATAEVVATPYWAAYYHNGRGIVVPRRAQMLVWFEDPDQDPRKPTNVFRPGRRLTKEEFKAAEAAGLLIITKRAGPAGPHPFFKDAEPDFSAQVNLIASGMLNSEISRQLQAAGIRGTAGTPFVEKPAILRLGR